ncbi:hypothetical protein OF83DRAFT_35169 [Amylostereum chailletii]|nr:hypothetical protein OF83DRAFT_35169 [Amylostereum chailletii]
MALAQELATLSTPLMRVSSNVLPPTERTPSFVIDAANRSYKHQYASIYFLRLRLLREFVETEAHRKWDQVSGSPNLVPRVLEVTKGQLCFVVGTVYMDMPLKPNVLEDIGRDQSIPAPPPLEKICSPDDSIMLEDESGRIRLVGDRVQNALLVTGVIAGALGVETNNGDFEVVDLCFAGMAPQEDEDEVVDGMDIGEDQPEPSGEPEDYAAFVSGLDVGSLVPVDAHIQMLVEYLSGEEGDTEDQSFSSHITRLVVLGNSLAPIGTSGTGEEEEEGRDKKARKYGHDNTSFSPHPILSLSGHLLDIAHSMPVHLLAGASDPSGTIMPQQPLPRAMFGEVSNYASFTCETNPTYLRLGQGSLEDSDTEAEINGVSSSKTSRTSIRRKPCTILASSGQPINDMFKYLPTPPATRLNLAESTLRWRHMAPTAPDTLWCHPFFTMDPFVLSQTPDIYVSGCQPRFATRLVRDGVRRCRIVLVPSFSETGVLVLIGLKSLNVRTVKFAVRGMSEVVNGADH